MKWAPLVMILLMAGLLGYQLFSGVVLSGYWRPRYRRGDEPREYWIVLLGQTAALVALTVYWIRWASRW